MAKDDGGPAFPRVLNGEDIAVELLVSLKEMREGFKAAMRVIDGSQFENADIVEIFVDEMRASGVTNGMGIRADDVIARAEILLAERKK